MKILLSDSLKKVRIMTHVKANHQSGSFASCLINR